MTAAAARMGRKRALISTSASASHPLATQVAVDVMRDGGNAGDAALAAAAVQTVVEPHMTTVTGVLSMLHFDAASGAFTYLNGSAAAPSARPESFSPGDAATGLGVAVPGWWAGFGAALDRYGSLEMLNMVEQVDLALLGWRRSSPRSTRSSGWSFGGPGPRTADTWRGPAAVGTMIEVDVDAEVRRTSAPAGF